jgi:DNA-binding XRE family transcriptional regulator
MANIKEFKLNVREVGKKLRELRREHNFVQDDLAKHLGTTRSSYASIERGTYGTRIEVLANIILFYQHHEVFVNIEDLIGLTSMVVAKRNKAAHTPGLEANSGESKILFQAQVLEYLVDNKAQTQDGFEQILKYLKEIISAKN